MIILDTDHMSLLEWRESPLGRKLLERLAELSVGESAVTIISFEEQFRGWMTCLAKAKTLVAEIQVYGQMIRQVNQYAAWRIISFDEPAAVEFQRLRKLKLRVATMDLKIAAIVLSRQGTLLSRNLRDFSRVPGLIVEDWTK